MAKKGYLPVGRGSTYTKAKGDGFEIVCTDFGMQRHEDEESTDYERVKSPMALTPNKAQRAKYRSYSKTAKKE